MNEKIIQMMQDIVDHAEDTLWLTGTETVFERCWSIVASNGGEEELKKRFPEYA